MPKSDLIEALRHENDVLHKRLELIDKGCFNCGGLPHTTDCRVADVKRLVDELDELRDMERRYVEERNWRVTFEEENYRLRKQGFGGPTNDGGQHYYGH